MKKKFEDMLLILIQCTNVMDGQTDGRTPHDVIGRTMHSKKNVVTAAEMLTNTWLFVAKMDYKWWHFNIPPNIIVTSLIISTQNSFGVLHFPRAKQMYGK